MEFYCNNSNYFDQVPLYEEESIRMIRNAAPGLWTQCAIGLLGFINNILLLFVSYRIGWFSQNRYYLILNQALVDLLFGLGVSLLAIRNLRYHYAAIPDILSQFDCISIEMMPCLLVKCSQRCALVVALDRLINVINPGKWIGFGIKYRIALIGFAWTWAAIQELPWFLIISPDACLKMCMVFTSISDAAWRGQMVTVVDTWASVFIIAAYAVIPFCIGSMHQRVQSQQKQLTVYLPRNVDQDRLMLLRVRRMSFLIVSSYLCTMVVGFMIIDLLNNYVHDFDLFLRLQPFATAWALLNTVMPLYLFGWKNKQFRQELKYLWLRVLEILFGSVSG